MYLSIQELSPKIFDQAESYFSDEYKNLIKNKSTYRESLVARYIISKQINKKYLPKTDYLGKPVFFDENYWSISHKKNIVFCAINSKPVGIDIEINTKRDISLLDIFSDYEYHILGSKNFKNFYIIWTAKESLIKLLLIGLDDLNKIKLLKTEEIEEKISDIIFTKKIFLIFKGKEYSVLHGTDGNIYYSISF